MSNNELTLIAPIEKIKARVSVTLVWVLELALPN